MVLPEIFELSELDNMDKHRSIIPTITSAEYSEGHALAAHRLARADLIDPFPARRKVQEGQILMVGSKEMMPPAGTVANAECGLAFGEIANVVGRGLLEELSWQADIITGVLFSFETHTFPKFTRPAPLRPVHVGNGAWLGPPGMSPEEVLKYVQEMALDRSLSTAE